MKEDLKKVENKQVSNEEIKFDHIQYLIVLMVKVIGPMMLVIVGLVLLAFRIAGWSLIFGLPTTIIGIVLLIYVYDDVLTKKLENGHNHNKSTIVEEE